MPSSIDEDIKAKLRGMVKGLDTDEKVRKATLQQQWHVVASMLNYPNSLRDVLGLPSSDDAIEVAEPEAANPDDDEKIAEIDAKTSHKEKIDAWLTHMRARTGKEAG